MISLIVRISRLFLVSREWSFDPSDITVVLSTVAKTSAREEIL